MKKVIGMLFMMVLCITCFAKAQTRKGNKKLATRTLQRRKALRLPFKKLASIKKARREYQNGSAVGSLAASIQNETGGIRIGGANLKYYAGPWQKSGGRQVKPLLLNRNSKIESLPHGCRKVMIGQKEYFYYHGSYYQKTEGGYKIVEAPLSPGLSAKESPSGLMVLD